MYCALCKVENDLMPKPYAKRILKSGIVREYYICNLCNTARNKRYRKTAKGKQAIKKLLLSQRSKYPVKDIARRKLAYALEKHIIRKPNSCDYCNSSVKLDGHHKDYNKPLDVIWLCRKCHTNLHKENRMLVV